MQTSKLRNGSSNTLQRTSPVTSTRSTKLTGTSKGTSASKPTSKKAPTDRSPKVLEHRSSSSPVTAEKKRPSRLFELESQLTQLQEDLKKTKDQLTSAESLTREAQQEAEELKQKLRNSQNQPTSFTASEECRLHEHTRISEDQDQECQSDLEAIQKHQSTDSPALSAELNEIQRLKLQLAIVVKSEPESLSAVEKLKKELTDSESSTEAAEDKVIETQQQLEVAKAVILTLRSEGLKLMDLLRCSVSELERSKARVCWLEETMKKLMQNSANPGPLESEGEQLIHADSEIHAADETASGEIESELESALKNAEAELAELRVSLSQKETELNTVSEMQLKAKVENQMEPENVSVCFMDKNNKAFESDLSEVELAKAKEKAEKMADELELAKAENMEMEVELRRLRVQSEQWRKAAEAAAAVLTTGSSTSLDAEYRSVAEKLVDSPFADDLDLEDDPLKKRKSNVLSKFGGLLKKTPK